MLDHQRSRWGRVLPALLLVWSLTALAPVLPAQAQDANIFTVNSTEDKVDVDVTDGVCDANPGSVVQCTLRAAIMEANITSGAQTIQLPAGTYRLTIKDVPSGADEASGDLDVTSNLIIKGTGNAKPVIDAVGLGSRVLGIAAQERITVRLQNLVIRGGDERGNSGRIGDILTDGTGGGILITGRSQVTIENSTISDNVAVNGGGIGAEAGGSLTIIASRVQNNEADGNSGGGIFSKVNTAIRTSTISGNRASFLGGGILAFNTASLMINLNITQSSVSGNSAVTAGGGIATTRDVNLFVRTSTISGNSAPEGGGIRVAGSLTLRNATITRNSGGGVASATNAQAFSTIIASNSGADCAFTAGTTISGNGNLAGDRSCPFADSAANKRDTNPVLGPLQSNGGETKTHALLPGSPAIGGGQSRCSFIDQRNFRGSGASCDIGAFQSTGASVGVATVTPAQGVATVGQTTMLTLRWTVPQTMTWTDLSTIDLQLRADDATPLWVRFTESVITTTEELTDSEELTDADGSSSAAVINTLDVLTNGLSLRNENGEVVGQGLAGEALLLESDSAVLDLGQSRIETDGPDGKTVTLTLAVRFKQPLVGKSFTTTLIATDDAGIIQGPDDVGTLAVGSFTAFVPLVAQP